MEVHFDDSYAVIYHQIMYLPIKFSDVAVHTVEFWVVAALNHAIILVMFFLHIFNPIIYG